MDAFYKLFSSPAAPAVKYHGLHNHGATCYLNSVLQVLFMTKEFRDAVISFKDNNPNAVKVIDPDLKDLFDDLLRGPTHTYKIISALKIDSVYEQRDALEYFEKILNLTRQDAAKIFHGQMAHRTTCSGCETETDTDGPFWHLPFELVDSCNGNYSVVDGIKKYFQPSNFSGDNQMYCDTCDCKVDASSKYVIKRHPGVLILLLKRFDFSYRYMSYVKIMCDVDVPYILKIPENQTYELYAVVDHFGDLRGGHYAATIKSQDDEDRWFSFDDIRVTPLDRNPFTGKRNTARFANAYLLFYRKKVADIQGKRRKKRPGDANSDEHNLNIKKRKKTGKISDTNDQEENKTLLSTEDLKEIKVSENTGLTNNNQMTPDVKITVNPGDSERSPLPAVQDEMNPAAKKLLHVKRDENKQTETTQNSDSHEQDMKSKDENTDEQEGNRSLLFTESQNKIKASPEFSERAVECDRQGETSDPQEELIDVEKQGTKNEHKAKKSDFYEKNMTSTQKKDKNLLPSEGQTKDKDPENIGLTETEEMNPDVNPEPGASEVSAVPAACDRQGPISAKTGVMTGETEKVKHQTKISEIYREPIPKNRNLGAEEKDQNVSTMDKIGVKDPKNSEQTETEETKPDVDPDVKPGDREVSADRQDDICDPQRRSSDGTTDNKQEEQEVKHETENSDGYEEGFKSEVRTTKDQEENSNLPSTGDQAVVKDPDESEQTEINQMTPDVKLDPKPGDSERSPLPAVHDEMNPAAKKLLHVKTDENKQTETTQNYDSHEQDVKSKDENTDEQEGNRSLLSTEMFSHTEVRNSEESEQTVTEEIKPDVDPDVKPGDSKVSADRRDDTRDPPGGFIDEETKELEIQHVKENCNTHTKDVTVNNKDADDQEENVSDEGQNEIKASLVFCERPVCDKLAETSDPQEEFIDVETKETRKRHEAEKSDFHEKDIKASNSDQKKDKIQLPSEDRSKDQEPENVELTQTKEMKPDVKPGASEVSAVSAGHDTQDDRSDAHRLIPNTTTDNIKKTESSGSHVDETTKASDQDKDQSLSPTGDQAEVKDSDEAEQTEIYRMTPDVKLDPKPGDSERSPLPAVQEEMNPAPKKLLHVKTDENKLTETTQNSDSHAEFMSEKKNFGDEEENGNVSTSEKTGVMDPKNSELTKTKEMKPHIGPNSKPGDSETSGVLPGHDRQDDTSDPPRGFRDEEREGMKIKYEAEHISSSNNPLSLGKLNKNKDPKESELTDTKKTKPDVKHGDRIESALPVVGYNKKTRSHEEQNQSTAGSSGRSEQNVRMKDDNDDDDDEVNKRLFCAEDQVTIRDVEGGAEKTRCTRQSKYKIVMSILAILLVLGILVVVFTVRL